MPPAELVSKIHAQLMQTTGVVAELKIVLARVYAGLDQDASSKQGPLLARWAQPHLDHANAQPLIQFLMQITPGNVNFLIYLF